MKKRSYWPPHQPAVKAKALRLMQASLLSVPAIAEKLGLKESTLRTWACEFQISLRGRGGQRARVSRGLAERGWRDRQIAAAARKGMTHQAIGDQHGISRARVGQILLALGLTRNGRRRAPA